MSARNYSVPNVGSKDHSRTRRLFDTASRQVRISESLLIRKSHSRPVSPTINDVITVPKGIINRIRPGLAIELELKPFVVVDSLQKLISHIHRDVEVGKRVLIILCVNEPKHVWMRHAHHSH